MSTAIRKASSLKPEIRLAQAVSEFEAELDSYQKAEFCTWKLHATKAAPSSSDVMRVTADIDRQISKKYGGQCFGPRFTYFLQGVQQFAALGDVIVGGSQNILACGVWSLVRMSMLSLVNIAKYADKLSLLFMDIGRASPRHQAMALLYPRSTKLQSYLFEYFIVVVALCRHIHQFSQKSTFGQLAAALNDARLQVFFSDLAQWATNIKEETNLQEYQETSGFRAMLQRISETSSQQHIITMKLRILDFCSTYNHQTTWKQTRKAGRTSFFEKRTDYTTWRDSTRSCTLVCTGKLGSGKSVLLANMVDDLSLSSEKEDRMVTYFFCKADIQESLQARTVIGCLARQMLCSLPNLVQLSGSFDCTQSNDTDAIVELLKRCLRSNQKAYIVLDGLDECNDAEKEVMLSRLLELQEVLELHTCLSMRLEPHIDPQTLTRRMTPSSVFLMPDENPDIDTFIAAELDRCLCEGRLVLGDARLILDIEDALVQGSKGMFLWAALQIKSLCGMKTDQAIREALADLPKDLPEIFQRILHKSGDKDRSMQRKILRLVIAAFRPLTTDELREALSVTPGLATWDRSRILNNVYSALACCGSLLIIDEEESTVSFVHHSVHQFLTTRSIADAMGITIAEAQSTMADIVVTYLGYGELGTELSRSRVQPVEAQSAPSRIVHATLGSSSLTAQLSQRLLRSRRRPSFDMSAVLAEARRNSSVPSSWFKFHVYAKGHWSDHVAYVSRQDESILTLATRLLRARVPELQDVNPMDGRFVLEIALRIAEPGKDIKAFHTPFSKGPSSTPDKHEILYHLIMIVQHALHSPMTGTAQHNKEKFELLREKLDINDKESSERTPISWAAKFGFPFLVQRLLDVDIRRIGSVDWDRKDRHGFMPLSCAAENGHADVVELLLGSGQVDLNAGDKSAMKLLSLAIRRGRKEVVEVLLCREKVILEARDDEGRTPLMSAVNLGKTGIVELLLRTSKVNVEAKDKYGMTPLADAAVLGNAEIVKLLLTIGNANVEARSQSGKVVSEYAVGFGHRNVVELLVTVGEADVEVMSAIGRTLLHDAVWQGHNDIVELLLTTGKANANAKDKEGNTPRDLAVEQGHHHIVRMLDIHESGVGKKQA